MIVIADRGWRRALNDDWRLRAGLVDQLDQRARRAQNLGMARIVNLYQAKTQLSALVEAAASGEEIVIAKNGVARARLVPLPTTVPRRIPTGLLDITYVAEDFDAPDPEIEALFEGNS